MIDVFRKVFEMFEEGERRKFRILVFLMVLVSISEVFGISIFLVLLHILSEPTTIFENQYLSWTYNFFGFSNIFQFQVFLSLFVLFILTVSMIIKAGGTYAVIRFSMMRGYSLSSRLLASYLHRPYHWYLERNSSEVTTSVVSEVQMMVNQILIPGTRLLSNAVLATTIVGFLLFVDMVVAVTSAALLGGSYVLIYLRLRAKLLQLGKEVVEANKERFRLTQEATGGFKEVKILGLEDTYVSSFQKPARRFAGTMALSQVIQQLPRFALEMLAYAILMFIVLFLIFRNSGDLAASIPTLGVFALSVMRLLPAIQQIYGGFASIRNAQHVLQSVHSEYISAKNQKIENRDRDTSKLPLKREITLRDVEFSYSTADAAAIKNLNLTVPALSTVGIVGGTGAGKTTVIDLILGLLLPNSGEILVDGVPLTRENIHAWRKTLGYVPQTIYLADATIAQNIAFGVAEDEIDMAAVERAAKTAALHEFVMSELPEKYDTKVGERGVRLSGGQRQRIGIARALYYDPSLLILDEATAALDNLTESAVMEAVQSIRNDKTIIMIAHRLGTVRKCDTIFLMEKGQLVASGTYDELVASNETFRRMAANE